MKTHAYSPVRTLPVNRIAPSLPENDPSLWAPAWELPVRVPARRLQEEDDDED